MFSSYHAPSDSLPSEKEEFCNFPQDSELLGMAACTGFLDHSIVNKAILETKTKDVEAWIEAQIGKTFLSKRRESLGGWRKKKTSKKNMPKKIVIENVPELTGAYLEKVAGF